MSAARVLAAYRTVFSTLIVAASVQTMVEGSSRQIVVLAAVEIAAALLLLWRRTQCVGTPLLLVVFACAQALAAAGGEFPTRFLQYAASAVLIVTLDRALSPPARA